jgi:hypothetical protein
VNDKFINDLTSLPGILILLRSKKSGVIGEENEGADYTVSQNNPGIFGPHFWVETKSGAGSRIAHHHA